MKVISIIGSPNGMKGYTGSLLERMLEGAQSAGAETEIFSLSDLSVEPCNGCTTVCHTKGACQQKDDCEKIRNAMLEADGIILATPNYFFNVSAQLKALIDRCNLLLHCQRLIEKYGAVVVTSGGSDPEVVENYLLNILRHFGLWTVGSIAAVGAQFQDDQEKARIMESAAALGSRLVNAIKNKETFPDQDDVRNQAFAVYEFIVTTLKKEWPFAYDYWKTHWGLKEE